MWSHILEGLEDQIALGEVEDKGLDHLEHAGGGEFQIIHAMKGGRMKKVRVEPEKGNNIEGGGEIYRRVLRVLLALIMETRRGTEESPRGLCERLSSTRPVNEAKQGEDDEEREQEPFPPRQVRKLERPIGEPRKARYCSLVSFGGVVTGKSKFICEQEKKKVRRSSSPAAKGMKGNSSGSSSSSSSRSNRTDH